MCGRHGIWRLLPSREQTYHGHHEQHGPECSQPRATTSEVEREVKTLYARGELDRATFQRLLEMARNGYLTHDDVESVRRATSRGQTLETPTTVAGMPDSEEARLREKIRLAEQNARAAETDEERQAFLEIKQGAQYRLRELETPGPGAPR